MKPVELNIDKLDLDTNLYKLELRYYSNDDGCGYNVRYTSKFFSEELTTMIVNGLMTWDTNMCKSLIDTVYIHSGELLLDD